MEDTLHSYATAIIDGSQALLGEKDGLLNTRQRDDIKVILANAERFIHVYAECQALSPRDFVANMRHEIGNPLTPIRGYSELLLMGVVGTLNERQQSQVQGIVDSTNALRRGVEDMLNAARAELARQSA